VISADFTSPPSKTEVRRSSFSTQCYVDVQKAELHIWIIQIIGDNSERHLCDSVLAVPSADISFICFVTGVDSIVLQMPRNSKRVT